ncbi:MAG: hypothetical protein L6405_06475 [Actinomycetia bacterium]|nr:hypothetical protein [Actinomycetes bacterium]
MTPNVHRKFGRSIVVLSGLLLVLYINIIACSKDGHIVIKLTDKHLEETPSGFWLAMFELDYSLGGERMKKQVMDKLKLDGKLIDEFVREDGANTVYTRLWKYKGEKLKEEIYKGGIWNGPKVVPFQEYHYEGWTSWITIEFENGIPYSTLLPDHYTNINPKRKYEHTATIESVIDQGRRLFLFGYGSNCKRISLF